MSLSRRKFFSNGLKTAAEYFVLADAGIYILGSAFKELDGNLTAGAKGAGWYCVDASTNTCGYFSSTPTYTDGPYPSISACTMSPTCQ